MTAGSDRRALLAVLRLTGALAGWFRRGPGIAFSGHLIRLRRSRTRRRLVAVGPSSGVVVFRLRRANELPWRWYAHGDKLKTRWSSACSRDTCPPAVSRARSAAGIAAWNDDFAAAFWAADDDAVEHALIDTARHCGWYSLTPCRPGSARLSTSFGVRPVHPSAPNSECNRCPATRRWRPKVLR